MIANERRGSRKHILDWTGQPSFREELAELLLSVRVSLPQPGVWMPRGHDAPAEARLTSFGPSAIPHRSAWDQLRTWWLAYPAGANTPNWDLAALADIEGQRGLVLIEAKANEPELSEAPKPSPRDNPRSHRNHAKVGAAIAEACEGLRSIDTDVSIARDSHYQLSNRLAFTWKLASLGVPTVLVYMGFIGDTGMRGFFTSEAHWRAAWQKHTHKVCPERLLEMPLSCGGAPFWLLVRSREVLGISPKPSGHRGADAPWGYFIDLSIFCIVATCLVAE